MKREEAMIAARLAAGIFQEELAELSGVSISTIRRLEIGQSSGSVPVLLALAHALGISLDTYLDGPSKPQKGHSQDEVEVFVPLVSPREDPNLFIGVNGVNYLLPKGRRLMVPAAVAAEYHRAQKAAAHFEQMKKSPSTVDVWPKRR